MTVIRSDLSRGRRAISVAHFVVVLFAWPALLSSFGCPSSSSSAPAHGTGGGAGSTLAGTGGGAGTTLVGTGGSASSSDAGDAGTDAASPPDDGSAGASDVGGDRGPDAGLFGIAARAAVQTCKAPATYDQPVAKLSATGCVDPGDAKKPAASLIPYDVNSPLWSDGADKQRFLALPDGAVIHVKDCAREPDTCKPSSQGGTTFDEGHWVLPVGTVLVKSFLFAGKFIETRLFVRFPDIWYGFSYRWNGAQTDADLVSEDGLTADVVNGSGANQSWLFPGRNQCLECHNETVGGSLGLETRQFERSLQYPSGIVANQIATLEHIGAFDAPVVRMAPLTDYTRDTSAANLEARARSYLHANCAICHRPEGNYSAIDLRIGVALDKMNVCNIDPNKGDQGVAGAKRVVPSMPEKSVMLLRMQAPDKMSGRMPQLATSVLDTNGIDTISAWIRSIATCP